VLMYAHAALLDKLSIVPNALSSGWLTDQWAQLFYLHTNLAVATGGPGWRTASWNSTWSFIWSSAPDAATGWFSLVAAILGGTLLFFVLVVLLAATRMRRSWREEPAPRKITELQGSLTRPRFAVPILRRLLARSLDRNPIGWLQQYSWSGRITKWGWLGVIMAIESLLLPEVRDFAERQAWVVLLLLVGVAFTASASFRKERDSGALELLLVCPLSVAQVITGRLRGIWMQFLPSGALLTLCLGVSAQMERYSSEAVMLGAVVLSALIGLPIIGLYFSLYRIHFLVAWLFTILFGIVIPFLLSVSMMLLSQQTENLVFELVFVQFVFTFVFGRLLYRRLESRRFAFAQA
jgi:ABC-type transport system involved in cytochrome c biogenesis permease component